METIEVNPRGYCHGVVTAMQIVSKTASDPNIEKPIYVLGHIVHNENVSIAYEKLGVITLDGKNRQEILNKVHNGTVIITAHGIDPNLKKQAIERGLNVIDATCSDVEVTHKLINSKLSEGFDIVYIGKKNHPEPEAAVGINPKRVHLVSEISDIDKLSITNEKLILTNQTTLSMWSLKDIIESVQKKYPQIEIIKEICDATKLRQEAVYEAALKSDLVIVVGDPKSNNTNKLAEISMNEANTNAIRIASLKELDINYLLDENVNVVAVTSGASTPSLITKDVSKFIKNFEKDKPETHKINYDIDYSRIIPKGRKKNV